METLPVLRAVAANTAFRLALASAAFSLLLPGFCKTMAAPEPPSREIIKRTILDLGDPESGKRDAAYKQILTWGLTNPDELLAVLPAPGFRDDQDMEQKLKKLHDLLAFTDPSLPGTRMDLLTHSDPVVRTKAISRLWSIAGQEPMMSGENRSIAVRIAKRLTDPSPDVRKVAASALGFLQAPAFEEELARLLDDTDEEVRIAAGSSLLRLDRDKWEAKVADKAGSRGTKRIVRPTSGNLHQKSRNKERQRPSGIDGKFDPRHLQEPEQAPQEE